MFPSRCAGRGARYRVTDRDRGGSTAFEVRPSVGVKRSGAARRVAIGRGPARSRGFQASNGGRVARRTMPKPRVRAPHCVRSRTGGDSDLGSCEAFRGEGGSGPPGVRRGPSGGFGRRPDQRKLLLERAPATGERTVQARRRIVAHKSRASGTRRATPPNPITSVPTTMQSEIAVARARKLWLPRTETSASWE